MDLGETTSAGRLRRALLLLCAGVVVIGACSADNETPLGSELIGDILGSKPGETFTDTLSVINETVHEYYTMIDGANVLGVGRADGYERAMILRPGFSKAGDDTNRTVVTAEVRVVMKSTDEILSRFYHLAEPFFEGDSVKTLDTLYVLPDPNTGAVDRTMNPASALYPIDPDTVQGWIRGEIPNNGVLVLYNDPVNDKVGSFASRSDLLDPATLKVTFTDGTQRFYPIVSDGTFIRPTQTTTNPVVSDGFVRRLHFSFDLQQLGDSAAVHTARLLFHLVPGTVLGTDVNLVLFVPDSEDPATEEFLDGTPVQEVFIDEPSGIVEFRGLNLILAVLGVLEGQVKNTGFTLRFDSENTQLRQAEFYSSSAADSLRPRMFVTWSNPAEYDR